MSITPESVNPFGSPIRRDLLDTIETRTNFWNRKPQLQLIAQLAAEQDISAWGLLLACMAHRLGHVPPNVVLVGRDGQPGSSLRAGTSVNGFFGITGGTGGGKSITFRLASDLIPPNGGTIPDGTGQGIIKALVETKTVHKDEDGKPLAEPYQMTTFLRHSLTIHAPEVKTLNAEFMREGSKTADMMRSIWVGETVGMTNSGSDRNANLPPNMGRVSGVWGVQPHNASAILSQAEDGTPQRFLWAPAEEYRATLPAGTRNPPPPGTDFPYPVFVTHPLGVVLPKTLRGDDPLPDAIWVHWSPQMAHDIAIAKAQRKAAKNRDPYEDVSEEEAAKVAALEMESHLLLARIKCAVELGWLWGHASPDDQDWELAGIVLAVSKAEMAGLWKTAQQQIVKEARERGRVRALEMHNADGFRADYKNDDIALAAKRVWEVLRTGPHREGQIASSITASSRPYIKDALRLLSDEGKTERDGAHWWGRCSSGRIYPPNSNATI